MNASNNTLIYHLMNYERSCVFNSLNDMTIYVNFSTLTISIN